MVDNNYLLGLATISFYSGNRFDLVQAGGGNTSVKTDNNTMLVKASGINLSEVTESKGHVAVDYLFIRKFVADFDRSESNKKKREKIANDAMNVSKLVDTGKPSIETFLHALLNTYTLHTHPISINVLAAQTDWQSKLLAIWPDAVCVPYHTPGIDLALSLAQAIEDYQERNGERPKVAFLQNHGLIVSADTAEEVMHLTDAITEKVEAFLNLDLNKYRNVTQLQTLLSHFTSDPVSIVCNDDSVIDELLPLESKDETIWPFCPDTLIYCGVRPVFLDSLNDESSIHEYVAVYQEYPKVLVINNTVYFCATTLKKAKEAQDLFKFHLLVIKQAQGKVQRLSLEEIAYLSNWDAEKYRQGV